MNQAAAAWLVIILAVVGANLPFFTERVLGLMPRAQPKGLGLRLVELFVFYLLVGGVGLLLEQRAGRIAPQGWEFYAVTGSVFLTLAFPGFVYRYLMRRNP